MAGNQENAKVQNTAQMEHPSPLIAIDARCYHCLAEMLACLGGTGSEVP